LGTAAVVEELMVAKLSDELLGIDGSINSELLRGFTEILEIKMQII
jgi:hypothetical protein